MSEHRSGLVGCPMRVVATLICDRLAEEAVRTYGGS